MSVLVGKNGSGKSVLLRSWRDQNQDGVHYVAPERTGEMSFQPNLLTEEMQADTRRNYSTRNFVQNYRSRILGRIQTFFMVRGNARNGLPASCDPKLLEDLLTTLISDFQIELRVANPPYRLTRIENGQEVSNVDQLSSGEAQLLTIGLDILTISGIWEVEGRRPRIILLDEPDAHIHPDLLARFADFLFRAADQFSLQVVVSTHSTSLLSALAQFGGDKTSVVFLDRTRNEYRARRFDAVTKEVASCLGGHVLMGPLFGAPLLLVEGDDDYRLWSQVPRHHIVNIAVLPTNGDEIRRYQLALERILSSLCDVQDRPIGYALLDGDKAVPTPNPDNGQKFVQYLGLGCHEAENLYLTDVVLDSMGLSWSAACDRIVESSARFGENARLALNAPAWDRRSMNLKPIMRVLVEVLDSKGVPWTTRVGAAVGKERPKSELALFLGAQLVDALWGGT